MNAVMCKTRQSIYALAMVIAAAGAVNARDWWLPYKQPCTERENVFAFTEKPAVKLTGRDKYEITFTVKGNCDVTVGLIDKAGKVVRHLGSGVLGSNAPAPFQKNSVKQTIYWNGKDDLGVYVKEPEKLKVRVMLGLKPQFDHRLGGKSPHNIPGYVCGIAVGPEGAVVLSRRWRLHARKFNLDGEYAMSIHPPPAGMPEKKMAGMGYVEYEPGKKAVQAPTLYDSVSDRGWMFWGVDHGALKNVQPVLYDGKVYFVGFNGIEGENPPAPLYYLKTDGSTDFDGVRGVPFSFTMQTFPRLAISPDGKWMYMTGAGPASTPAGAEIPVVLRRARTGRKPAEPFLGKGSVGKRGEISGTQGADNDSFNGPAGIACDSKGRIYVCDSVNGRIQIFSPEGTYLKTVPVDRPMLIQVHQKTGAIYVLHTARKDGKSLYRLTKFGPFDDPREVFHQDNVVAGLFALDSWSAKPRLWLAGGGEAFWEAIRTQNAAAEAQGGSQSIVIYEEDGNTLKKLLDFDERAKSDDGPAYYGRWRNEKGGSGGNTRLDCDPVRERVYYHTNLMFDLPTKRFLGQWNTADHRTIIDDIAFDKKGFMHVHFNPYFYFPGVGRVDTRRPMSYKSSDTKGHAEYYPEAPYDYGIDGSSKGKRGRYWKGVLPVKDQGGAHAFQFGLGVNMRGDVAVQSQIYYVPKMEDSIVATMDAGAQERKKMYNRSSVGGVRENAVYNSFLKRIKDQAKQGEAVYFIRRRPGVPLSGSTVWTYDASGELRKACAAIIGGAINGVEIDEDGDLYFLTNKMATSDDKGTPFLHGKGGTFGGPLAKGNLYPMTGAIVKTRGDNAKVLLGGAVVSMQPVPSRPPELINSGYEKRTYDERTKGWVDGAYWIYAGVSPIRFRGCHCPSIRFYTDWYKRTFAPEAYRHSIGVLDTNGNLVMHIGQYGNFDSGEGPKSRVPVGGDGIGVFHPRAVGVTDNYIVFSCWGERVMVLKIGYHAEESVPIVP